MNLTDLRKIDKQIKQLKLLHQLRREDYIKENCPYKVGDTIPIEGYSIKGKSMMVGRIRVIRGWSYQDDPVPYKFKYSGYVLKKDGHIGKLYTDFEVTIKEEI
jgi:hypothetical protein